MRRGVPLRPARQRAVRGWTEREGGAKGTSFFVGATARAGEMAQRGGEGTHLVNAKSCVRLTRATLEPSATPAVIVRCGDDVSVCMKGGYLKRRSSLAVTQVTQQSSQHCQPLNRFESATSFFFFPGGKNLEAVTCVSGASRLDPDRNSRLRRLELQRYY
jgi:hypothetical protein